ncbi:unnamed protein product [Callosobruchus maculatus]|uniref:Uncharacterized protein n=1 Tax=Callosobruchus maculatus TaxID=64391 RepID=A0A653BEP0_CALMS|nr:unnamed protein product [Callosobruchus maculatus]
MDKQFSNKQKGYWGAANTNNSTSSYAAGMSQWSWPQTTANTTQGYGSTSNDGAKLTAEQWAAMSMYYAAQKKVAETSAQTFEGYSTSAVGGLYGTSATTNLYARTSNQRTMSGYNTGTSYYGTQNTSQQKPVQGYNTANQQMTNKLYGGINTNMTGSFGELSEATKGYENLGMSYGAGSSDKFSEGSMTGTSSMPYGGSMRSSGASGGFAGPIQSSENKKMLLEGAKRAGNNTPYGEASRAGGRLGSSDQPPGTYAPRSSTVASKGRFYGTDRETPLEVIDLRDDSDGEHEQMPKRQAAMGYRRLSPEQDEYTGPRQRYADKDTYVGNKASVSSNRYYDEPQLKNNENRSSWNKTDSSYNRDEWRHHDYKSADTNRSTDASMDRSAWHQKDDIRNPFEAEESKLSWNRYGSSYDEESGASSKNRDLYDRNEDGRSWKERDTSFNKGARNDPGDFYSRDERGRIWKQQGMEEDITSQRKRKNMEEERPLWKRRPMGEEHISPWKKQAFEEEKMAPLRRQDVEEDTMPPWKKKVMERKMLEGRAMQGWMSTSKNPRLRSGEENVSSSLGAIEGSLPPWKRRIEEKMAPPWSRERNEEKVPPWKKKNAPTPNKKKGRFLSKKQKGKARKKNKKKLREEKFFQRKGQKRQPQILRKIPHQPYLTVLQ